MHVFISDKSYDPTGIRVWYVSEFHMSMVRSSIGIRVWAVSEHPNGTLISHGNGTV